MWRETGRLLTEYGFRLCDEAPRRKVAPTGNQGSPQADARDARASSKFGPQFYFFTEF